MAGIDKKFLALFLIIISIFLIASVYYYHKTVQEDTSMSWVDFRVYYSAGAGLEADMNIYDMGIEYFVYKYTPVFALAISVINLTAITPAYALGVWYFILFLSFTLCAYLTKEMLFFPAPPRGIRFFDIIPLLFAFRYLILINFISSYLPIQWPTFIHVYDFVLLYLLIPSYVLSLFYVSPKRRLFLKEHASEKGADKNYLIIMPLAILFILRFLVLNIDRAQVNILILLLLFFFVYYFTNKKDTLCGIYLGIAIAIKLTPVIFLVLLLIKKRFKAAISAIAAFAALLFIPCFRWGINANSKMLSDWLGVLRDTFPSEYLQHKNQSLMAAISRLFSVNSDISLLKFDGIYLTWIVVFVYAVFMLITLYAAMKKSRAPAREAELWDLGLFFLAMTVLSPVGTKTTFVYILLPVVLLIREAFRKGLTDRIINTGLLAYVSLVYLNSSDIIGNFSTTLHKYSLMTFCILIIFALTVYAKHGMTPVRPPALQK
ncbi:MAG: DUF2029 domain-containing protein [Omnitrophica bacterium]|nr:DUF2029 domain-containing protein [Candidatus Omnitrophota bacterium]